MPARELNPEIDPSFEAIILKAMSKNPMERFATAKDMRSASNDYPKRSMGFFDMALRMMASREGSISGLSSRAGTGSS